MVRTRYALVENQTQSGAGRGRDGDNGHSVIVPRVILQTFAARSEEIEEGNPSNPATGSTIACDQSSKTEIMDWQRNHDQTSTHYGHHGSG
jgi:hypothetical protein